MKWVYKYLCTYKKNLIGRRKVTYFGFELSRIYWIVLVHTFRIHILYEAGSCPNHLIVIRSFLQDLSEMHLKRTVFGSLGISWWKMYLKWVILFCFFSQACLRRSRLPWLDVWLPDVQHRGVCWPLRGLPCSAVHPEEQQIPQKRQAHLAAVWASRW